MPSSPLSSLQKLKAGTAWMTFTPLRLSQLYRDGLFQRMGRTSYNHFQCQLCQSSTATSRIISDIRLQKSGSVAAVPPPFNFPVDVKTLSDKDREKLRLYSKSIPLVADNLPLDVIYEDADFLCVNKPDFIKMHPAHRFEGGSLLNRAISHLNYVPFIIHRLDMHTTGVVIFAKNKAATSGIAKQFHAKTVQKQYLLIADTQNSVAEEEFSVDAPIQRTTWLKFAREIGDTNSDSKAATTEYKLLDTNPSKNLSLYVAYPKTGRTHQIRLHAAHAGRPIVGDSLYNPDEFAQYESLEALQIAAHDRTKIRYAYDNPLRGGLKLHAWKLSLDNPSSGQPIEFCAPPSGHFQELLTWTNLRIPPFLTPDTTGNGPIEDNSISKE